MESDSRREKGEEKPVYGLRFNLFGVWYGMAFPFSAQAFGPWGLGCSYCNYAIGYNESEFISRVYPLYSTEADT